MKLVLYQKDLKKVHPLCGYTIVNKKIVIISVLLITILLITGCGKTGQENPGNDSAETSVLATVNGEDITSSEVSDMQQGYMQQGQQVSVENALEQMINKKILIQNAQEEYTVSNEEAEEMISNQLTMQNMSLENYKAQLQLQGQSYEKQLKAIKEELMIQEYLNSALGEQDYNVTEEEARAFYEAYKDQSTEEIPSYEEIEDQVIATVKQQKQQQATSVLLQELRDQADIEYKN